MVRREPTAPLLVNQDPRDSFDDEDDRTYLKDERSVKKKQPAPKPAPAPEKPRNVIMMISDGFGPASQTYGRTYWQYQHNYTEGIRPSLDHILVGSSRTRSSDSLITDSAAGATAFSCAMKSYNAAIGVDPARKPCGTVLEAAKSIGMFTGLVVTSRVTHATPAAFSAHVVHRDMEQDIAEQQIGDYVLGRQVDLLLGGGRCFFLPNTTVGSCRTDGRDLIKESQERHGWKDVLLNSQQLANIYESGKVLEIPTLGLFHPSHMNFEIDRKPSEEPALNEMTWMALESLKKHSTDAGKGFFLMVEGSRIDMAAHNNDPVAHVHEILEYYRTVEVVRRFVAENPETVLISTSDHETGGFTLGLQPDPNTYPDYLWRPEVIERATTSTEILTQQLAAYTGKDRKAYVRDVILGKGLGIRDASEEEIAFLADINVSPLEVLPFLGHAISRRANLGWTTMGHTGVDVNLYADTAESSEAGQAVFKALRGNHENTEIGEFMSEFLRVSLKPITEDLNQSSDKWFKPKRELTSLSAARSEHEETGH
ncbi:hypothetical protein BGZ94_000038 [Podila epigama]|nr:hypothetical protein BGZ94_000038 [Podila epigama]